MTSRERVIAASRGGEVDRRPVICWPHPCPETDVVVDAAGSGEQVRLKLVVNPFGQALRNRVEVWDMLAEDPDQGEDVLGGLVGKSRAEIKDAFAAGADGILYLLYGARGLHATPMEYGGHYLERDRELLAEAQDATFNLLLVVGEADTYLDFVSDLPAHAFGWDAAATGVGSAKMRSMRSGALATNDADADVELRFGTSSLAAELEMMLQENHANV